MAREEFDYLEESTGHALAGAGLGVLAGASQAFGPGVFAGYHYTRNKNNKEMDAEEQDLQNRLDRVKLAKAARTQAPHGTTKMHEASSDGLHQDIRNNLHMQAGATAGVVGGLAGGGYGGFKLGKYIVNRQDKQRRANIVAMRKHVEELEAEHGLSRP